MAIPARLLEWLRTDADPSVEYRLLRDVLGRAEEDADVEAARQRIGRTGWAAELLALQLPGGQWSTPRADAPEQLYRPKYIATNWQLIVLSELGLPSASEAARRACHLVMDRYSGAHDELGGPDSEVCFTGNAVRYLRHFGFAADPRVRRSVEWLIATQKRDGGWHCAPSESGTLDGWEALAAFAEIPETERSEEMKRAIVRGADFYLDRELLHEGEVPYPPWSRLHYPVHYYYDLLVGLEFLTRLGYGRDPRLRSALELLERRRDENGAWNLDALHPDLEASTEYAPRPPYFPLGLGYAGRPSPWITVRALAVLRRAGRL